MLAILVAEDIEIHRDFFALLLRKLGHTADFVADGEEALAAARSKRYDVIFMDMQMPVMGGCEATRLIRSLAPEGAWPYIIALSGTFLPEERAAHEAAGIDDFVLKPTKLAMLTSAFVRAEDTLARRGGTLERAQ